MKLRYWTIGSVMAGGVSVTVIALSNVAANEPLPSGLTEVSRWRPEPLTSPVEANLVAPLAVSTVSVSPNRAAAPALPTAPTANASLPMIKPPLLVWSREIASGDTLDGLLAEAGLTGPDRAETSLAISAEYDLRRLRPGHVLTVEMSDDGSPRRVALDVDDGVRVEATFGDTLSTRVVSPEPEIVVLAGTTRIENSIFAALEDSGIPPRFAVDLAQMLGGTVDFRRDLGGGETLRLLWHEARVEGDTIGQPKIAFASLDLGDALYEVVWPEDGTGRATMYLNGEMVRVFAEPVQGARLSSVFGRRKHPIYGNVRMHTGVDFAAPRGTSVRATAPGRIAFIGRRGGYGRVVEIAHGTETMTRYAHLSAVPDGLAEGQRVTAGDTIGRVGATGTATGPNLHYEVRVDGRPTDPLSDERLSEAFEGEAQGNAGLDRLAEARARLEDALASDLASNTTERL
ncbi:M23 family metallopeptidase [Roseivivax sp. THAF30]|uniref:M23 family metallopeptidase n=1 Tax=Roseivivax sp. THAF30 TaxID=2587852 RepID=UPI00126808AF|nr:M23 family metallopeptidase [Roseivivax sp. THAF30]QFT61894.1 Murein DD-endopeptidase MepM [Roseivivax sp. THAF30]